MSPWGAKNRPTLSETRFLRFGDQLGSEGSSLQDATESRFLVVGQGDGGMDLGKEEEKLLPLDCDNAAGLLSFELNSKGGFLGLILGASDSTGQKSTGLLTNSGAFASERVQLDPDDIVCAGGNDASRPEYAVGLDGGGDGSQHSVAFRSEVPVSGRQVRRDAVPCLYIER